MATSAPTMSALTTSVAGVDAGGGGQRDGGAELRPQDGDPAQGQPQLPGLAQLDPGDDVERLEVEVGLVEAVEQHQPVGAGVDDLLREVGHRRVVGAELHGQRDRATAERTAPTISRSSCSTSCGRPRRIGGHPVEVELERIGAGVLQQPGVARPSRRGGGVQAGDDRDRQLGLERLQPGEVAVAGRRGRRGRGSSRVASAKCSAPCSSARLSSSSSWRISSSNSEGITMAAAPASSRRRAVSSSPVERRRGGHDRASASSSPR